MKDRIPWPRLLLAATLAATAACSGGGGGGGGGTTDPAPALHLSTTALTFEAAAGGAAPPAEVTVTNAGTGTLAPPTVDVSYADGAGWLSATVFPAPGGHAIAVAASATSLAPGSYHATLAVASAGAADSPQQIAITFQVNAQPLLSLSTTSVALSALVGGQDVAHVEATNAGTGLLSVPTVELTHPAGQPTGWLTVAVSGDAAPYLLTVTASAAALAPGEYGATVRVRSDGAPDASFDVAFTVAAAPALHVSPTQVTFEAVAGGAPPAAQALLVTNTGGGSLGEPAVASDAGWLQATVAASGDGFVVTLAPDPAGLAAGVHEATVTITAEATGSPQAVSVTLTLAAPPPRTVTVHTVDASWLESGAIVESPWAEWLDRIELLPEGASTPLQGALAPDLRSWTVADVPAGPYRLAIFWTATDVTYLDGSADAVDLGWDSGGAPARAVADAPTPVTFALTGLAPWADGHSVTLASFDARARLALGSAAPGATTASPTFDLQFQPLLEPGDTLRCLQHATAPVPGTAADRYELVVAAAERTGVAVADGQPATVDVALAPVAASRALALDWRVSQFHAAMGAPADGLAPTYDAGLYQVPVPQTGRAPLHDATGFKLLQVTAADAADRYADAPRTLAYGTVSSTLPVFLAAFASDEVWRSSEDGLASAAFYPSVVAILPAAGATGPVVPLVGAPRLVTVGGVPVSSSRGSGVGATPVVAWSPPAAGTPSVYRLHLLELVAGGGAATVLELFTAATQVTLPEGLLQPGRTYVLELESRQSAVTSPHAPWRIGAPGGSASAVTQPFTP